MKRLGLFLIILGGMWLACDSNKPSEPNKIPIAINSPAKNATVFDTVNITTTVGAGYSFSRIDFYIDGDSVYADSTSPFSYKWYAGNYFHNSHHVLRAIAYDSQTYESDSVAVTVIIPGGPIDIISPIAGVVAGDSIRIIARKAAAYTFQRVVFYVDSDSAAVDTSAADTTIGIPTKVYSVALNSHNYPDNSTLILTAKAVAGTDSIYFSQPVTIYTLFNPLPDTLQYLSFIATSAPALRVASEGGHLYVATGSSGVLGVDISNPNSPSPEFTLNTADRTLGLDIDYPFLAVADGDQGAKRFDVSNPNLVQSAGAFNTSGQSWNVKISGTLMFIADNDALQILRIPTSNDSLISLARVAILGGQAKDIDAIGEYAYVIDNSGLTLVDVSSPAAPVVRSRYTGISGIGQCISIIDTFAFVGTTAELVKLSIADPDTVKFISRYTNQAGINGVFATESAVFIAIGGSNGGAMALDYRSHVAMTAINQHINGDNCHDICAVGPFIFLAGQTKVDILRFVR